MRSTRTGGETTRRAAKPFDNDNEFHYAVAVAAQGDLMTRHVRRLKQAVREQLGLPLGAAVILSELRCGDDPGADAGTLIAVLVDGRHRAWWVSCSPVDLAPPALRDLVALHPDGGHS